MKQLPKALQRNQVLSIVLVLFTLFQSNSYFGQLTYIGLKNESNVREAQDQLTAFGKYWPKTQLIDGYLYVPTTTGIYRKSMTSLNDTIWQLYAFENFPIRTFVKKNNSIIAATAIEADSNLLLLSTDNGASFSDYTSASFFDNNPTNTILRMGFNPHNPNSILALHQRYGVSKSDDFGATWTHLNPFLGGYQDWFIDFNPNDTNNIFYTGEQLFEQSYINASYDGGSSWTFVDSLLSHCTHGVAFHPTNKDHMISYGEGRVAKSTDQGLSWTDTGYLGVYIFKILYDENNPDILYASGDFHGINDTLTIYRSIDSGNTWHTFYTELVNNSDGIMDLQLYDNKLIVYTLINGVYYLDLNSLGGINEDLEASLNIHPNPVETTLNISSDSEIRKLKIYDLNGRLLENKHPDQKDLMINIEHLSSGSYLLVLDFDKGSVNKQFVKK